MRKFTLGLILSILSFHASAATLRLDFDVDINQYFTDLSTSVDPDINLSYSVFIDTSTIDTWSDTFPDGKSAAVTVFASATYAETQFTDEVYAAAQHSLGSEMTSTAIQREYSEAGFNNPGTPETFQAIFLNTNAFSDIPSGPGLYTSYQRGLQWQHILGEGDLVTEFTGVSFTDYMTSLVGDSGFYFTDSFIVSEIYEDNSGNTVDQYGYSGVATLTGVSEVPVPAAAWLFGSGLLSLGVFARRRTRNTR